MMQVSSPLQPGGGSFPGLSDGAELRLQSTPPLGLSHGLTQTLARLQRLAVHGGVQVQSPLDTLGTDREESGSSLNLS